MHSDQTRKDGSSESMIQALYYDFVANYVKTRMYSTRYVQCNSGGQSSADRGATESGSAGVLSSLRCCYSTECEETGHLLLSRFSGNISAVTWLSTVQTLDVARLWITHLSLCLCNSRAQRKHDGTVNEGTAIIAYLE